MKQERTLFIEGKKHTLLISDELQALLEAKASGRAVLGCLDAGAQNDGKTEFKGIPYVIPSMVCNRGTCGVDPAPPSGASVAD